MVLLLVIYISLLGMALLSGMNRCEAWSFQIDMNRFNSPYFCLGIDYHAEYTPRAEVSVLCIGFVVINVTVEFYRFFNLTEEEKKDIALKLKEVEERQENPSPSI